MASKFGGIPVDEAPPQRRSRFGGIPVEDFGNVQADFRTTEALAQAQQAPIRDLTPVQAEYDATEGMGGYEMYRAGLGKSIADTARGAKQALTSGLAGQAGVVSGGLRRIGLGGAADALDRNVGAPLTTSLQQQYADAAETRRLDAPLTSTLPGGAGNAIGTIAQFIGPGLALRGSSAGAVFLPRTLAGNVVQGGAVGAVQPVASEAERGTNAATGAALGGAGVAIPKVAGAVARPSLSSLARFTERGVSRRAAEQIAAESSGLASLLKPAPSAVPGVRRTLAEESLDPGVARLERNARSTQQGFDTLDRSNNEARVAALRQFAGDDQAIAAAEAARDATALPLLKQAQQVTGVDTNRLISQIERADKLFEGRPAVQQTLRDVRDLLFRPASAAEKAASPNWPDLVPRDEVAQLYNVRKTLDDLIGGKLAGEKPAASAARRELMVVKNGLDRVITKAAPEFGQYLDAYRSGSKVADRMKLGNTLVDAGSGSAILDPVTGQPTLTAASFGRQAQNLDKAAASATGFRKARAANILQPEDMSTIRAIQDDLNRRSFAATAGTGGNSQTFERLAMQDRLGASAAGKIPLIGGIAEVLNKVGNSRVNAKVAYLLQNPEEARRLLATLPAADRVVVEDVLARIGGTGGALVPALSE